MRSLTSKQIKALNEAARTLYTANERDNFGDVLIRAADCLFEETKISVDQVMVPDGRVVHWVDKNYPASSQEFWEKWPHFSHEHPGVQYVAQGGKRPVVAISDFLTQREFLHLGLYDEIYKPNEIKDQIATVIPLSASVLGLAISAEKSFRQEEKICLTALQPHLLPAFENHQNRLRLAGMLRLSTHALDIAREGIVFCARHGRIRLANQTARQLMSRYFQTHKRSAEVLPEIVVRALMGKRAGSLSISGPTGILRMSWSPAPDSGFSLLLTETRKDSVREKARVSGLSRRESEVAHWLAQGKTNDQISQILGISRHTARTHVERILAKLQVATRTAAAAKLMV